MLEVVRSKGLALYVEHIVEEAVKNEVRSRNGIWESRGGAGH